MARVWMKSKKRDDFLFIHTQFRLNDSLVGRRAMHPVCDELRPNPCIKCSFRSVVEADSKKVFRGDHFRRV